MSNASSGPGVAPSATLSWVDEQAVLDANGPVPKVTAKTVCGSDTETFLVELLKTAPGDSTVQREWADVDPAGAQVSIRGVVKTTHLGPPDIPMNHALGDDLSMNVLLEKPFLPYTFHLGPKPGEEGEDAMHVEISAGYIPHVPGKRGPKMGQIWNDLTDQNRQGFQPGFAHPNVGDTALVQGRYIVDCGHPNYSSELHAMSFVAWTQTQHGLTTARAYYNGYRDSEDYNVDFSLSGQTEDPGRFELPGTRTLPDQLEAEAPRLLVGKKLRFYGLLDAVDMPPLDWQVCAPPDASGSLRYAYDFVTRSGVKLTFEPDAHTGCVAVHTNFEQAYRPADIATRRCDVSLKAVTEGAKGDLENSSFSFGGVVGRLIPANILGGLPDLPMEISCADALAGPKVNATPSGRNVRVDDGQPFPFYGVLTVTRTR
ncbi:MAG: hypothetical protein QM778_18165 [Myxococcales bacterium]